MILVLYPFFVFDNIVVFMFYVPQTVKAIRRQGNGLNFYLTDFLSRGLNLRPMVYNDVLLLHYITMATDPIVSVQFWISFQVLQT